ncbi:NAD(P) transhydrogenase (B-specific) [Myxococcus xanthus DK 1622]|uniref:Soluble pyridine nucleotide transhydrogenase n=1 Tax=Myxococcus xanthus (strain DK1622) TaxID=246197 RepID=Q1D9P2_MYXXD|nr:MULTISPECIES: Si-specific NAD(P)(+) transhydrogenase [Myxococcus]ABF91749.1 NAD(P) transhydrogenase (B-specific) [Myxococcus xanthus DK 1622]NOJ53870.1 Si-specific NAD(P)(+) transhydrogenase [Myxococcus xanthus]QPM81931.1 Si-specific NAD(P)(+) transhydrogenase [Myxococcus xanthus]QVW71180.1 Si-specific NAD(P)(+) transhydrogenase [Myxococcus xanthus DZ2]QZZ50138.1 putative soluble pyridine nucleotide transhydrogenase [Myxococcus xanthus]
MADFDLVVIGSGPAGEWGAVQAALAGKRVAVVEREPVLGGTAANTGTLPSKTLRETALHLSGFRARGLYSVETTLRHEATVSDFLFRERRVKDIERERIARNLQRHKVEIIQGTGALVDANTVVVRRQDAPERRLTGGTILVATGSSPYRPPLYPFEDPRIHDSDEVLELERLPRSLVVVGAGVIGCEYACMFAAMDIPVTLVEARAELLPFLDDEFSALLGQRMEALGIQLRFGQVVEQVDVPRDADTPIRMMLSSGAVLETDQVLVASGRTANTAGLGLEALGVQVGPRGQVEVGPTYQTALPHIYAVGDVIGFPALASTSMDQARIAVEHAFDLGGVRTMAPVLPYGIYTIPEVSMAGETEEALRTLNVPYVAGRAAFATNPRGQILGDTHGLLKLLFHRESLKLLGVHVMGPQASELVHVGLTALLTGSTARLFVETCFNYPTLSEAYKAATFDALDQLSGCP